MDRGARPCAHDDCDGGRRPVPIPVRAQGAARELLAAARDQLGDRAWVWSRGELLDEGLLGAGPSGSIPGRIGDVVLAARGEVAFVDPSLPNERNLMSGHGSLSPDEMLVPCVAAYGRG